MSDPTVKGPMPMVEVQGLERSFGSTRVLHDVAFEVAGGEFVTIVGPSGSGKTTLLHLLAGLDRADGGRIIVAGTDVAHHRRLTRYRRDVIGLVFQLHNLIPRLTAAQNVALAMFGTNLGHRERARRADELLKLVGLENRTDSTPPNMSGGERQRVAVARALANRPKLSLADEPTGSLDDDSAKVVLDVFDRLREESGLTMVAVSHDVRLNVRADRLLRLADGSVSPGV